MIELEITKGKQLQTGSRSGTGSDCVIRSFGEEGTRSTGSQVRGGIGSEGIRCGEEKAAGVADWISIGDRTGLYDRSVLGRRKR